MRKTVTTFMVFLVGLLLGGVIGWHIGSMCPVARFARDFKAITGLSDTEIRDFAGNTDEMMKRMKEDDYGTAVLSLAALVQLERGTVEKTKKLLAAPVTSYYVIHNLDQYPNRNLSDQDIKFRDTINRASEKSEFLRTAIAVSLKNVERFPQQTSPGDVATRAAPDK